MAKVIDQVGVYRGEVIESVLKLSKAGHPMFVIRLRAYERFIELPEELAFFKSQGVIEDAETPQWVDWSGYEETIYNYMNLFNMKDGDTAYTEDNASLNYKQIQLVFGWDGTSFEDLNNGKFNGSKALFRVAENNNPEYTGCQVKWLDTFDAPPQRELKGVGAEDLAKLNKLLRISKKKGSTVAAAPSVAAAKPAAKPVATPAATAVKSVIPAKKATPPAPAPTAAAVATPVAVAVETPVTKDSAWASVCAYGTEKGQTTDVVADAWIAAVAEVSEEREYDEDKFTSDDWAKVQSLTAQDLG